MVIALDPPYPAKVRSGSVVPVVLSVNAARRLLKDIFTEVTFDTLSAVL
jgi:hypothetical protein